MNILIGLLSVAVGALFCFRGEPTARVIIPIWGAFMGFLLGAGLVAMFSSGSLFGSVASWIVGLGLAALFGWIANAYYNFSIAIVMGSAGFVLATSLLIALGVTANWLLWVAGLGMAAVFFYLSYRADMPRIWLKLATAFSGASVLVFGLMLIFGAIELDSVTTADTPTVTDGIGIWALVYVVVAVAGLIAQIKLDGNSADSYAPST